MPRSFLTGRIVELPKREPPPPEPTELEKCVAELRALAESIKGSGAENAKAIQDIVQRAANETSVVVTALERQAEAERQARAEVERTKTVEVEARIALERQVADLSGRLAAAEGSLAAERVDRERLEQRTPTLGPSTYALSFSRDKDGRIDSSSVKIRRE